MKKEILKTVKECETCKYQEESIFFPECFGCLQSKRWALFNPKPTFKNWKAKEKN